MINNYDLDMKARQTLARNLRTLMQRRGLTQMQVAKAGGVSQTSVSLALRAENSLQLDIIEGIARGVGVGAWELLNPAPSFDAPPELSRLLAIYSDLPEDARRQVLSVAEFAESHSGR